LLLPLTQLEWVFVLVSGAGQFGPKVHHVYECNDAPVDAWTKKTADTTFAADGRFDWHMERFDNHMGSLQFATKRRQQCAAKRDRLLERGKTPAQADLVIEAADLLVECRHVCAWTYAFAYFIADKGSRNMLAFVQKDLESYTEQLSAKVERQDIDDLVSDEQGIRALVSALTTFKDAMVRVPAMADRIPSKVIPIHRKAALDVFATCRKRGRRHQVPRSPRSKRSRRLSRRRKSAFRSSTAVQAPRSGSSAPSDALPSECASRRVPNTPAPTGLLDPHHRARAC
jgi:hypothetical protein